MNLNTDLETGLLGVRSFLLWTALAEALEAALRARLGAEEDARYELLS